MPLKHRRRKRGYVMDEYNKIENPNIIGYHLINQNNSSMTAVQNSHLDGAFGRLHRGLTSSDRIDWKEPKPRPVRRPSQSYKKEDDDTGTTLPHHLSQQSPHNNLQHQQPYQCNQQQQLHPTTAKPAPQVSVNSVLGPRKWGTDGEFVKLDKESLSMVGVEPSQLEDRMETETLVSETQPRESSVFSITETEKYILKQIMNLTQDKEGLQVHRNLAATHLVRVQTHMENPLPSEVSEGGYIHLPNRTKMKRHYMKKLGKKALKTELQIPQEYCSIIEGLPKYDPWRRREDLKNTIVPLVKGTLPPADFRFRHLFVVDMEVMENNKVDLNSDKVPVFPASHPEDKYIFNDNVSDLIKKRSKRLMASIRIAFNNRLYWKDVMKGKSKPSSMLEEHEKESVYRDECARFLYKTLDCKSMMYYIDVFDEAHEYGMPNQGYLGILENSPRLLEAGEGEDFHSRLMSHLENDSNLLETVLAMPRLWRQNFYDSTAGNKGILQRAPAVLIVPLDFGLFGGQPKTKQTDRLRYLQSRYMKYFGGVSPVTLNMNGQGS